MSYPLLLVIYTLEPEYGDTTNKYVLNRVMFAIYRLASIQPSVTLIV